MPLKTVRKFDRKMSHRCKRLISKSIDDKITDINNEIEQVKRKSAERIKILKGKKEVLFTKQSTDILKLITASGLNKSELKALLESAK